MTPTRTSSVEPNGADAALVIGNFDGVHRGHQALVAYTLKVARAHGLRPIAMTFDPHPAVALGGAPPPILTKLERKLELLGAMDPALALHVQRFDREFAQLSPREFVERVLVRNLNVRQLVVGANFRFGRARAGNVESLRELGKQLGFTAHAFSLEGDDEGSFSSSRIRSLIAEGDLVRVSELLGRPHCLTGKVVVGDGRGRQIGVPTANLAEVQEVLPRVGVYAGNVELVDQGAARPLGPAVVHIGPRPTVDRDDTVEAHLLDQSLDLYGQELRLSLGPRIRDLVRFSDIEALKQQIVRDISAARGLLGPAAS